MYTEFPVSKILVELTKDNLLPAILFRTSRKSCDEDVERLEGSRIAQLRPDDQRKLEREIYDVVDKYRMELGIIQSHPHYTALVRTGVGAHHAGQLLLWRLLLEELMTRSALRLMIATGTVAAGVDFPARTVVITAHSKRGNEGFNQLTAAELQQMSGRAGRRGKDTVGICLVAPSRFSDARVIQHVAQCPPEPLRSAYFAAPSTVLNLLKYRNIDDLRHTVARSLAAFHDRKAANHLQAEADARSVELEAQKSSQGEQAWKKAQKRVRRIRAEAEHLGKKQEEQLEIVLQGLRALGHIDANGLTEKGLWAAELCTSLVLELAEAIESGLLYDLSPAELVGLLASISGDSHRRYFNLKANPIKKEYFEQMKSAVSRVKELYQGPGKQEVEVVTDAATTLIAWMDASDWQEFSGYLRLAGVAEGDVSRLVTQTADHLNQIARLKETHPQLAKTAFEARKKILRPPITDELAGES